MTLFPSKWSWARVMSKFLFVSDFSVFETGIGRHLFVPHFSGSYLNHIFVSMYSICLVPIILFFFISFFSSLVRCTFFFWPRTFAPSAIYLSFNFVRFTNAHTIFFILHLFFFISSVCLLTTVIVNLYLTFFWCCSFSFVSLCLLACLLACSFARSFTSLSIVRRSFFVLQSIRVHFGRYR